MSRKPSNKPRPKPTSSVVLANKSKAAIGQLESAILLWFNEADPISILVLASNASDCYHALGVKIGKPSVLHQSLAKMSPAFQEREKYVQDFAKHGFKDLEDNVPFDAVNAECRMFISVECHRQIFGGSTPLMVLFMVRMSAEHPTWLPRKSFPKIVQDSGIIDGAAQGSRKQCFERFKPYLEQLGGF